MEKNEFLILRNLLHNDEYVRKVIPFLKEEYFRGYSEKVIFQEIFSFVETYNKLPSKESILIELDQRSDLNETSYKDVVTKLDSLTSDPVELKWLVDTTEKWCKQRAILLAITESIEIADGSQKNKNVDAIPDILTKALAVSFDTNIGHDYIADADKRYEFYNRKENKLPFRLEYLDKITNGGISPKTLSIVIAFSGVGKSLFLCNYAATLLSDGKNVLYITLEMSEEEIARRIDANLMNININEIRDLPKATFDKKIKSIAEKTQGNLVIKEYPTSSAHSGHFRTLLNDLALKKAFKPDIIFIDYLNICASSRVKMNSSPNSYSYVKSITEEVRGLAVEQEVPVFSAVQFNRSGGYNTDPDLTNTSDSVGIVYTADLMFAMISTEELEQMGQIMIKQLKNRYNDVNRYKKFVLGIDRPKMRFYDVDQSAQDGILDGASQDDDEEFRTKDLKTKFQQFT